MATATISLNDLIALNEEITALIRAGVPLDRGLRDVADDLRGPHAELARRIAERIDREGASLAEAIDAESAQLPALYRTVVRSGIQAGRLPAALEALTGFVRRLVELRATVGLALLYPALVLIVAFGLFGAVSYFLGPRMASAFESFRLPVEIVPSLLIQLGATAPFWVPAGLILMILAIFLWFRSGDAIRLQASRLLGPIGWLPGVSRLIYWARTALVADLLAVLIEQRVPMADALELASEVSGNREFQRASEEVAQRIRQGDSMSEAFTTSQEKGIPPLLRWLLSTDVGSGDLTNSLRESAETYRVRAFDRATFLQAALPTFLMLVIGGSTVVLYTVALFAPFTELLEDLAL